MSHAVIAHPVAASTSSTAAPERASSASGESASRAAHMNEVSGSTSTPVYAGPIVRSPYRVGAVGISVSTPLDIQGAYADATCLVTGGSGFVGLQVRARCSSA